MQTILFRESQDLLQKMKSSLILYYTNCILTDLLLLNVNLGKIITLTTHCLVRREWDDGHSHGCCEGSVMPCESPSGISESRFITHHCFSLTGLSYPSPPPSRVQREQTPDLEESSPSVWVGRGHSTSLCWLLGLGNMCEGAVGCLLFFL